MPRLKCALVCSGFNRIVGKTTTPSLMGNFRSKVLQFLHNFGETCAAIIGVYVIVSIIVWVAGCIWSCRTLQGVKGRRRWIQPFLPTKWVVNYDYGRAAKAARAEMEQEYLGQGHANGGGDLHDLAELHPRADDRALLYPSLKNLQGREEQDQKLLSELQEDSGFDK